MVIMETNDKIEPETFDFLNYATGTIFPEDTVDIYRDVDAAYQISKIETLISNEVDTDKVAAYDAQIKVLRERFNASKCIVHMRGFAGTVDKEITKAADKLFGEDVPGETNTAKDEWYNFEFIGRHIVKIVNAQGQVDNSDWDSAKVKAMFESITPEGIKRVTSKAQELTLRADIFENVEVNSGF